MIIDSHSFPDNTPGFGNYDLVILDFEPNQLIVTEFVNFMRNYNIKIKIITAQIGSNSILDVFTLNPLYIPVILLEINEKYARDYKTLALFASVIIKFIKYHNNSNGDDKVKNNYIRSKGLYLKLKSN